MTKKHSEAVASPVPYAATSRKTGVVYYLHARPAANGVTMLYFFAKEVKDGVQTAIPIGYQLSENPVTGLPVLKKSVAAAA